jgi:hypothetical protein
MDKIVNLRFLFGAAVIQDNMERNKFGGKNEKYSAKT